MIIVEKLSEIREVLDMMNHSSISIGFVPTMGALHAGHCSLISRAKSENQVVVSSIFVNPTQFNDQSDLSNYPRTPENDAVMLSQSGCDLLFAPSVEEMYPAGLLLDIDFGPLERVMEGSYRPGHFKGVATVVSRFFDIIKPTKAYFGEKDFQQLAIIREMTKRMHNGISIIGCETMRESDGLAMSSRNIHLTPDERALAGVIYKTLIWASSAVKHDAIEKVRQEAVTRISSETKFTVQYLEFVDSETLQPILNYEHNSKQRVCVAVLTSRTRLIDNVAV